MAKIKFELYLKFNNTIIQLYSIESLEKILPLFAKNKKEENRFKKLSCNLYLSFEKLCKAIKNV